VACLAGYALAAQSAGSTEYPQSKVASGRILQFGVYTLLRGGEIINSSKTSTGKSVSNPVITRDRETNRIPLIRDKYMAYQYRLSNLPDIRFAKLRRVLVHPPITLPDGSVTTGSDYTITQKVERNEVYSKYGFRMPCWSSSASPPTSPNRRVKFSIRDRPVNLVTGRSA